MTIRLILGDQLNEQHSWYKNVDDAVCYVMFEMRQETDYVKHHIQKVVAFFSAMRASSVLRDVVPLAFGIHGLGTITLDTR